MLIALGLTMLREEALVSGGVAGLALLLARFTDWPVGVLLGIVNLPFVVLSYRTMGARFTAKTIFVNLALMILPSAMPLAMRGSEAAAPFAGIVGGAVIGMGALGLARHGAGIGGFGAVALWLFRARSWNAGCTMILLDLSVLLVSLPLITLSQWLWSAASVLSINGILFVWHRPGRYTGY
jgi:uncharacterized membrane-anchored protein YitT (DUF2179 family)